MARHVKLVGGALVGAALLAVTACGAPTAATPTATALAGQAPAPTAAPQPTSIVLDLGGGGTLPLALGITGSGEVASVRDADLSFQATGSIAEVLVREGSAVKQGDLLAILDVRPFDQQLAQAEAALASARAQQAALTEEPRDADLTAARAQVRQAEAALSQLRAGAKEQDLAAVRTALELSETNLQSARDQLSFAKTQAELQVLQATEALTQAQARFSQAKYNWEYVQETGNDPIVPSVSTPTGTTRPNRLSDGQRESYGSAFVQAEAALRTAERAVELAMRAAEQSRRAEINGVKIAEAQVVQAQTNLEKIQLPADRDRIAAAEAALAQARAAEARLIPDPRESQLAAAAASVAQAESALTLAQINRERAELRAPFDGVIAVVNIDPGDSSVLQGRPAIQIVDDQELRVEAQISDVDITRVALGQTVNVTVDGFADASFPGTVSFIAPTATTNGSVRTYQVYVTLERQDGLRAGMNARVTITDAP